MKTISWTTVHIQQSKHQHKDPQKELRQCLGIVQHRLIKQNLNVNVSPIIELGFYVNFENVKMRWKHLKQTNFNPTSWIIVPFSDHKRNPCFLNIFCICGSDCDCSSLTLALTYSWYLAIPFLRVCRCLIFLSPYLGCFTPQFDREFLAWSGFMPKLRW